MVGSYIMLSTFLKGFNSNLIDRGCLNRGNFCSSKREPLLYVESRVRHSLLLIIEEVYKTHFNTFFVLLMLYDTLVSKLVVEF